MQARELSWNTLVTTTYGVPRVQRDEDTGCLIWLGKTDRDGYASRIKVSGESYRPHRLAYFLAHGVEADVVDHLCHTNSNCVGGSNCPHRLCIEPTHLESVTPSENIARGNTGIHKKSQTHCKHGHAFTKENTIVRKNGTRKCRTCARRIDKEYLARKQAKSN